jgi:two-component system sensor histidine kinase KdpD
VKADPVLLAQLIANLLDNALKYSDGAVDLSVAVTAQELTVSVKDRGPGIPEAERESIFQPYARIAPAGQRSAGLGLALCRAIAQAHGGSLTVRRRNGGGSHFCFSLPLTAQQPAGAPG